MPIHHGSVPITSFPPHYQPPPQHPAHAPVALPMMSVKYDGSEAYLPIEHTVPGLQLTPYRRTESDVAAIVDISNAPEVARWSYSRPYPYRLEFASSWLDIHVPHQRSTISALSLRHPLPEPIASPFVVIRRDGNYIGDVALSFEELPAGESAGKVWVLAYALHPSMWGLGIGTAAVRTLLLWAVGAMGVTEVHAAIETVNVASNRLVEKLGFRLMRTTMRAWPAHQGGGMREMGIWVWRI